MVENPIENWDIEAYRRVEQILIEVALDLKFPPEEAKKQAQKLLEPVITKSSTQTPGSKDP